MSLKIWIGIGVVLSAALFGYIEYATPSASMQKGETKQHISLSDNDREIDTVIDTAVAHPDSASADTKEVSDARAYTAVISHVDTTKLPLGDGKLSTSPKKGYVYSCQTQFSAQKAGAEHTGDWVDGDTWNLNKKLTIQGSVSWPNAWFHIVLSGLKRLITGNGLPVGSPTGTFPVAKNDPAYQIDRNPNTITAQSVNYTLPRNPTIATESSCVPMGAIGVMLNGTALFNALDAGGRDAVAHEVQDICNGHPEGTGEYHYHGPSDCVEGAEEANTLIGYALDGFGIYSRFDAQGREYTNADLDECHGIVSEIEWNGEMVNMYHYVMTQEYPYTVGCFRGTPVTTGKKQSTQNSNGSGQGGVQGGEGTPPPEAVSACASASANVSCSFNTSQGMISGTCRIPPNSNDLVCVPNRS